MDFFLTILIWLGSGFAFAIGILCGMWLFSITSNKVREINEHTSEVMEECNELMKERNLIDREKAYHLGRIATALEKRDANLSVSDFN